MALSPSLSICYSAHVQSHWGPRAFAFVLAAFGCLACSDDDPPEDENEGNVDFSTMCSIPSACGGDPSGEWQVAGGCVQPSAEDYDCNWEDSASGEVSGTLSFSGGSYSGSLEAELSHCNTLDVSYRGIGATYTVRESEIVASGTTFTFCVDGDTMLLWDKTAVSPDMSVLELLRSGR